MSGMGRTGRESKRPRVVLLTGEPGSGKTTLGLALSHELRIPFVSRDEVRGGLFFTEGAWSERPLCVPAADEAVEAMLRIVETSAGLGVSCLVEYVVRSERPRDLARIEAAATCVVIQTWCADALARCVDRDRADRLLNRQPVLDILGYETMLDRTTSAMARMRSVGSEMRTDFDLPTLRVNTDDGYTPPWTGSSTSSPTPRRGRAGMIRAKRVTGDRSPTHGHSSADALSLSSCSNRRGSCGRSRTRQSVIGSRSSRQWPTSWAH